MGRRFNPGELQIELFCRGARLDPGAGLEGDDRLFARTRAGLGSGLDARIPARGRGLWLNIPVEEDFAQTSPFVLARDGTGYGVLDSRSGERYVIDVPPAPSWYQRRTRSGTLMSRIGVLQGTYLGIYVGKICAFWNSANQNCKFCTTGLNVGVSEEMEKSVEDVVEVARTAREESGTTFVHLNSGYQGPRELQVCAPYVKALKEEVGILVGVQATPAKDVRQYDHLIALGADHFSFCFEFWNKDYFRDLLPGKQRVFGQEAFFKALEYTSRKMGKGRCSGEIIAGVEPVEDTLRAIDYITDVGAFPTVCIFRPVRGAEMEKHPSPDPEDMVRVFRHVYMACRRRWIPIGITPNIEVSLIVQPTDGYHLAPHDARTLLYEAYLSVLRIGAKPLFAKRMRTGPRAAGPAPWAEPGAAAAGS
jgi:hypothetical protein